MPDENKPLDDAHDEGAPEQQPAAIDTSLEGKGWDILVGGQENAARLGGEDPFDMGVQPAGIDSGAAPAKVPESAAGVIELSAMADESYVENEGDVAAEGPGAPLGEGAEPHAEGTTIPDEEVVTMPRATESTPETPVVPDWGAEAPVVPPLFPPAPSPSIRLPPAPPAVTPPPGRDSAGLSDAAIRARGLSTRGAFDDPFATTQGRKVVLDEEEMDKPVEPRMLGLLVTEARIRGLWDEINGTYERVIKDVRGHYHDTEEMLAKLRRARMLLMSGEQYYDNAEVLLMDVKAKLQQQQLVRRWSGTRGSLIAVYLLLWLALLSYGFIMSGRVLELAEGVVPGWIAAMYLPALFGSVGGMVGALWVLIKHTTRKRDFDPIHTNWYITNPMMGLILGMIAFLLIWGGGNALNFIATGTIIGTEPGETNIIVYAVCLIVGFNQNLLWRLIDRFIQSVLPDEEKPGSESSVPPSEGGAG